MALERLGYTGWFDPLICAEDVGRAKPNPEGFCKALAIADIAACAAVAFEDSPAGIDAARLAGLVIVDVRSTSFDKLLDMGIE